MQKKKNKNVTLEGVADKVDVLASTVWDLGNLIVKVEKNLNKKIEKSIDELAIITARGFERTSTKEELKEVGDKLEKLEKRVGKGFERVEFQFGGQESRIKVLEDKVEKIGAKVGLA